MIEKMKIFIMSFNSEELDYVDDYISKQQEISSEVEKGNIKIHKLEDNKRYYEVIDILNYPTDPITINILLPESGNNRYTIAIKTQDECKIDKIAESIYYQLRSNPDYQENNIILNMGEDIDEKGVYLYIFKEAKNVPIIKISTKVED